MKNDIFNLGLPKETLGSQSVGYHGTARRAWAKIEDLGVVQSVIDCFVRLTSVGFNDCFSVLLTFSL